MKAILLKHYGNLDALRIEQVPTPVPAAGEVLVKVKAFTISPLELKIRSGEAKMFVRRKLPMLMGTDFAGEIAEVGEGSTMWKVGDEVLGTVDAFKQSGPYAEYVLVKAEQIIPKPTSITFETACSLPISAVSALQCLRDVGKVKTGQNVLILGAAGSLGHISVQLAKQMGANVTAVCRYNNANFVKSLGADHVIDYSQTSPFAQTEAYDLIFDVVDKYSFKEAKQALRRGGLYLNTVPGPAKMFSALWNPVRAKKMAVFFLKPSMDDLKWVVQQVQEGKLKINIDKTYQGLESIYEATTNLEAGHVRGKLVIQL